MSRPLATSTALSPAWALPLHLLRTAWADQPFDALSSYVSGLAQSHLVEIVGEPVAGLADVDPAAGAVGMLPDIVRHLRRVGASHPAAEILSLLTTAPGDSSSLPPVPAVRADVAEAGWGVLIRDPQSREGLCLTCVRPHVDILRWRIRGVADCPVAPQPAGPSEALYELGRAVIDAADLIERSAAAQGVGAAGPVDVHAAVTRVPAGLPARVLELVDRIDRVEAITSLALARPGLGVDPATREPILRRLVAVKDAARRSAVAAAGESALREWGPR
ncbi:hypothetical protein [Dietzia aurantiaca]|uniref:DUF222 domain-containing protein n=1 Tax=Dietzia aurantiaca TaxID=983873 RepID=A0ABV9PT23_9ACTN